MIYISQIYYQGYGQTWLRHVSGFWRMYYENGNILQGKEPAGVARRVSRREWASPVLGKEPCQAKCRLPSASARANGAMERFFMAKSTTAQTMHMHEGWTPAACTPVPLNPWRRISCILGSSGTFGNFLHHPEISKEDRIIRFHSFWQ